MGKPTSKMKLLIILLFSLFSNNILADNRSFKEWTPVEKLEFSLFAAATYIDYRQSSWAMKQQNADGTYIFYEGNPMYGKRPSSEKLMIGQALSLASYYYLIAEHGDNKAITLIRRSLLVAKIGITVHNDSIGVSVSKAW